VLIVVLWASLGLVSVALLFGHSMVMNYRGADNDVSGHQADQAIEGAARYVETLLVNAETPGLLPDPAEYLNDSIPVGEATFYLLGRSLDVVDGTSREFGLIDEASKINLNAGTPGTPPTQAQLAILSTALKALPMMTEELADAIIDWQDADDAVTGSGAESETYLRFTPAYACKNAAFESIEELALLNGATREILYGEDANLNGVLDPNENDGDASDPPDNADGKLDAGILEYVTVFSRQPATQSGGTTPRIDVAPAGGSPAQVMQAISTVLSDTLGQERAQKIMQPIMASPLTSPLDLYITSKERGGSEAMTSDEFGQIAGKLTMSGGLYPAPVNVNTASETVLACLPGIGTNKAASLIAARLSRGTQDTSYAWIVETLGNEDARKAGPCVTGESWQVTADVAAVGRHGRGYRREKIVIDNAKDTPRIVYRRNLAPLGWALGSEIRDELARLKEVTR
jgi:type II secretory pathway component PulK